MARIAWTERFTWAGATCAYLLLALWIIETIGTCSGPGYRTEPLHLSAGALTSSETPLFADTFEGGDACAWSNSDCIHDQTPSLCDFDRPETETFRIHLSVRNQHGVDSCVTEPLSRDTWDRFCDGCADCAPDTLAWSCS